MPTAPRLIHAIPLLALLCAACSSLSTETPSTPLPGNWVLDSAASESPGPKVDKLVSKQENTWRARMTRNRPPGGGIADTDSGDLEGPDGSLRIRPDFAGMRAELKDAMSPPPKLHVEVNPEQIRLNSGDLPAIDYHPGEDFSRFDEYGTAKVECGWSDHKFVIDARYTNGAERQESYGLDTSGDELVVTRRFNEPGLGRIETRSVYRRA